MLISFHHKITATVVVPSELHDAFGKAVGSLRHYKHTMDRKKLDRVISELPEGPLKEFMTDFEIRAGTSDTFIFV